MKTPTRLVKHLVLAATLLGLSIAARGQSVPVTAPQTPALPLYRYRILGVLDATAGDPVEGAEVLDVLSGTSARTTKTGTVSLFFLREGVSMVRVRKLGYATQTLAVEIGPDATTPVTVVFERAQQLPAVVTTDSAPHWISPALVGFEARRRTGMGYFIADDVLRKEENRPLDNVLKRRIAGVDVWTGQVPRTSKMVTLLRSGRAGLHGYCYPDVYLDGVQLVDKPVDLAQFSVMDIGAVEFHNTATLPIEFNHTASGCGALFLWTRER